MISVVLATYNSEKFLKKQLDSILNQSVQVDEVVIVDDCSTDTTVSFIHDYIEKNNLKSWKLHKHDVNQGYIKTFRHGLSVASGDIIFTCDHDDIWMADKVEIIKKTFDDNPEVLYLATSFIRINEKDEEVYIKPRRNRANNNLIRRPVKSGQLNKMSFKDVAIYNIAPGCLCALRNCLKEKYLELDSINVLPHDWSLSVLSSCMGGLFYLDVVTTKYRIHSRNTIGLGHVVQYDKRLKVVKTNEKEKYDILNIVGAIEGNSNNYLYSKKIYEIFRKRISYLENKSFFKLLFLAVLSTKYGTVWESILYDCLAVVCG